MSGLLGGDERRGSAIELQRRTSKGRVGVAGLLAVGLVAGLISPSGAYERPGVTQLVSVSNSLVPSASDLNLFTISPALSGNGRFVAFATDAANLAEDQNPGVDVFVRDLVRRRTEIVSVRSDGTPALSPPAGLNRAALSRPSVSRSGRYVAFVSFSPNLVPGDTNVCASISPPEAGSCPDIFVHDRKTGETERVSVASDGTQSNERSFIPSISDDGRYVSFMSFADNLVPGDSNGVQDVFVHDRDTGKTGRASVGDDGKQGASSSICPALDPSGRFVAFVSPNAFDTDYSGPKDALRERQVYLRDLKLEDTELVSLNSADQPASLVSTEKPSAIRCSGIGPEAENTGPGISHGGRFVSFGGFGMVPAEGNGQLTADVYVRDRQFGRTERVSVTAFGEEARGGAIFFSYLGDIDNSGRFVVFGSLAHNLFEGDDETQAFITGDWDVFIHDRATGATRLLSIDMHGKDGACDNRSSDTGSPSGHAEVPVISGDGSYTAFFSCNKDLTTPDEDSRPQLAKYQVFARHVGPTIGVGGFDSSPMSPPSDAICIAVGICIPPRAAVATSDAPSDVPTLVTRRGADLFAASIAYRPDFGDLFARIELEEMSSLAGVGAGSPAVLYGLRFSKDGQRYEVRASSLLGGTFGLFRCSDTGSACTKLADLRGGYGTTGERVAVSIPLASLGLQGGGELESVQAFTALGSYHLGATEVLDTVRLVHSNQGRLGP